MSYARRRYKVVHGVLKTAWDGRNDDGWVVGKAEAWSAWEALNAPENAVADPAPEPTEDIEPETVEEMEEGDASEDEDEAPLDIPKSLKRKR